MAGASRIGTRCVRVCVITASTGIALMPHSISGAKHTESESACYFTNPSLVRISRLQSYLRVRRSLVISDCYWNAGCFFYFTPVIYPCACTIPR